MGSSQSPQDSAQPQGDGQDGFDALGPEAVRSDSSAAPVPAPAQAFVTPEDDLTVITDRAGASLSASSRNRPMAAGDLGAALAGERLNHFELIEYVGGGGMGAVFRARDTLLNREVALKVLSRDQGADDETRRRFQNEAQSAARLDHENIARVYYVGEDQGLNYIALEFIRGVNVRDLVAQKGPLPLAEALSYTLQIAEALAHASSRDVVHRDIKPSNMIITNDGRAKLVDMGLARLHQVRSPEEDLTASGVTLGTFDYISPEQARDPRSADVRSDIYSLGCTLYYMLTSRPPFPDGTVLQKLLQHQGDDPPDPRSFRPELPEAVSSIVGKMLAKDPRRRFQDPGQLVAELVMLASQAGLRTRASDGAVWIQRDVDRRTAWERHLPWLVPTAALLCVVAALELFSRITGDSSSDEPPPLPARLDSGDAAVVADARSTLSPAVGKNGAAETGKKTAGSSPMDSNSPPPPTADPDSTPTAASDRGATGERGATGDRGATGKHVATGNQVATGDQAKTNSATDATAAAGANGIPVRGDPPTAIPRTPTDSKNAALQSGGILQPPKLSSGVSAAPKTQAELSLAGTAKAALAVATSAGAGASTPAGLAPAVDETPVVFVIGASGEGRRPFASLEAACSAAKNNDVIELQYNGRREAKPITLSNQKLTIRGDPRYSPIVVFRPTKPVAAGFASSMITVAGGRLNVMNVALELDISREATAESWSLIETRLADEVRLERCWLTIRNAADKGQAYFQGVAFFNVKAAPGANSMMKDPAAPPVRSDSIELHDCVARGQAVFVRSADPQPFSLLWENGLLATSEQLLLVGGGSMSSPLGSRIELDLRHVTALARGGLYKVVGTLDAPYLLDTKVKCSDSVLLGGSDTAVIDQAGINRGGSLRQQIVWEGDHNFYQGFASFWRIVDLSFPSEPQLVPFPKGEGVVAATNAIWQNPPAADRAVDTLTTDEFLLSDSKPGEPMRFEASDGKPAGLDAARIPPRPPERPSTPDGKIVPDDAATKGAATQDAAGREVPPGAGDFEAAPPPRSE